MGGMYPSDDAVSEMRVLMDRTGFTARLEAMGAHPSHAEPVPEATPGAGPTGRPAGSNPSPP